MCTQVLLSGLSTDTLLTVTRECIEAGDALYALVTKANGVLTFGQFIKSMDDLYCTMNNLNLALVLVPLSLYHPLVQKETVEKVKPFKYRVVRQEWDYQNRCSHCLHYQFIFFKSQRGQLRSKCCASGWFTNRFENNETLLRNSVVRFRNSAVRL